MDTIKPVALHSLIFHVTGLCNLKCRHCWQSAADEKYHHAAAEQRGRIAPQDLARVLREGREVGLQCVKFTGGEPLLHPQIMDYMEVVTRAGMAVHLETNGTLLNERQVQRLKMFNGLLVAISLDGASAATHDRFRGVEGAFERAVAALRLLVRANVPAHVIMCLHQGNRNDLDDLVRLGNDLQVASIKINPIQPLGRAKTMSEDNEALSLTEILQAAEYCARKLQPMLAGDLFFSLPMAFRPLEDIRRQHFSVCRILQILGLLPNGDVSICGVGNLDARTVFGNIYQESLAAIWQRAPFLKQLRQGLPEGLKGVCARCILKAICLGECRAMAFEQSGDLMGAFWICQQAYEAGLFPPSRLIVES